MKLTAEAVRTLAEYMEALPRTVTYAEIAVEEKLFTVEWDHAEDDHVLTGWGTVEP